MTWLILAALLQTGARVHSAGFSTGVSPWTYLLNQAVMIVRYLRLSMCALEDQAQAAKR